MPWDHDNVQEISRRGVVQLWHSLCFDSKRTVQQSRGGVPWMSVAGWCSHACTHNWYPFDTHTHVHVYVYVKIYVFIHTLAYMYIYIKLHNYLHMCMRACKCMCMPRHTIKQNLREDKVYSRGKWCLDLWEPCNSLLQSGRLSRIFLEQILKYCLWLLFFRFRVFQKCTTHPGFCSRSFRPKIEIFSFVQSHDTQVLPGGMIGSGTASPFQILFGPS